MRWQEGCDLDEVRARLARAFAPRPVEARPAARRGSGVDVVLASGDPREEARLWLGRADEPRGAPALAGALAAIPAAPAGGRAAPLDARTRAALADAFGGGAPEVVDACFFPAIDRCRLVDRASVADDVRPLVEPASQGDRAESDERLVRGAADAIRAFERGDLRALRAELDALGARFPRSVELAVLASQLLAAAQRADLATAHLARALGVAPFSVALLGMARDLHVAAGDEAAAAAAIERARRIHPRDGGWLASLLDAAVRVHARDAARALDRALAEEHPQRADALLARAAFALVEADVPRARACLSRLDEGAAATPRARALVAACRLGEGDADAARRELEPLADAPGAEVHLWRAEAALAKGDVAGAERALLAAARFIDDRGDHPAYQALLACVPRGATRLERPSPWFRALVRARRAGRAAPGAGSFAPSTSGPFGAPEGREVLGAMGLRRDGVSVRAVVADAPPTSPRSEAKAIQRLACTEPVEVLAERFAALDRAHPGEVYGRTYLAEVLLWYGRFDEARAALDPVLPHELERWPRIGVAIAELASGDAAAALARMEAWRRSFAGEWSAPAASVHGEALLRAGRAAEARPLLEDAVRATPTRLATRLVLALAAHALGDREALRHGASALARAAPLAGEVAAALGVGAEALADRDGSTELRHAALDTALELLRGNRASSTVTFVDRAGRLRVVRSALLR